MGNIQNKANIPAEAFGIEVVRAPRSRDFRVALFDFDGTLSLIREGWREDMIPYFCEELAKAPGAGRETPAERAACVAEFVDDLTGKQTIFQCMQLAEEVRKRGGVPKEPMEYKTEYLRRLMARIDGRREGLRRGDIAPAELLVRGAAEFVRALQARGIEVFCASGTDRPQVLEEAALLGLDELFDGKIYGALDEHAQQCSKEVVLRRILRDNNVRGEHLLSFGDGPVEIRLVAELGGYAVAVATDEQRRSGVNPLKREKLLAAGALAVVPDFGDPPALLRFLFG